MHLCAVDWTLHCTLSSGFGCCLVFWVSSSIIMIWIHSASTVRMCGISAASFTRIKPSYKKQLLKAAARVRVWLMSITRIQFVLVLHKKVCTKLHPNPLTQLRVMVVTYSTYIIFKKVKKHDLPNLCCQIKIVKSITNGKQKHSNVYSLVSIVFFF